MSGAQAPVSLGFLLWRATLRWQRMLVAALRPLGLTHVQFVLLAVLWWHETVLRESPTQRALSDQAGTDPMMTSQVVRALERKGLLVRRTDSHDSRALRLELTPEGTELAIRAIGVVEEADAQFFGAASDSPQLRNDLMALAAIDERRVPRQVRAGHRPPG